MRDELAVAAVVVAFAVLVTVHASIVYGLLRRPPRWHAVVAFALVPAAPILAFRERMRVRGGIWVAAAVAYIAARFAAT